MVCRFLRSYLDVSDVWLGSLLYLNLSYSLMEIL